MNITYDSSGNPLIYDNGNRHYHFNWEEGRQLAGVTNYDVTYKYNQDGIRISKEENGFRYEYDLDGTQIVRECQYNISTNNLVAERKYYYDANGTISSAKVYYYGYSGNEEQIVYDFYFRTNIFGDVIAIYNGNGDCLASFAYDAWGNFTETFPTSSYEERDQAKAIPFRYRGYYYDTKTGFYYLNSRYYDPSIGRFINADGLSYLGANGDLNGYNLYAYCSNNPVMFVDPNGNSLWDVIKNWFKNIIDSVEAEIGLGVGIGASGDITAENAKVTAEAYRDNTLFFDDGKIIAGNKVSAELSIFGMGIGGNHSQYTDGSNNDHYHGLSNSVIDDAKRIINCPKCNHNYAVSKNIFRNASIDTSGFLGASGSLHAGIGFHFSIGLNLNELRKRCWGDLLK